MELDEEVTEIGSDESAIDAAFAAAFARSEGADTEATEETTPSEEETVSEGRLRDEHGRFTARETDETETEEDGEETEEAPPEATRDPEIDAFLSRYGNDPNAALRAAVELDKLRGRQGDELGQLRQELAELRGRVDRPSAPITESTVEDLDSLAVQNPQAAIVRAQELDPSGQLFNRVMDVWFSVNPREASAFQSLVMASQIEAKVRSEYEPMKAAAQQSQEDAKFVRDWETAKATRGDLDDLSPAIRDYLEANEALTNAILQAEGDARVSLILTAADIAAARTGQQSNEVREIATSQAKTEETAAKKAARVVKPSAAASKPGAVREELSEDDRIRQGILGARDTSILAGLTYE